MSSFVCEWTKVCVGILLFEAKRVLTNIAFKYWYKVENFFEYQRNKNYNVSEGEQVMASSDLMVGLLNVRFRRDYLDKAFNKAEITH